MNRAVIILALVISSLSFVNTAQAYTPPVSNGGNPIELTPGYVKRVRAAADRVFKMSPCAGQVRAEFNFDLSIYAEPGNTIFGASWREECLIRLAPITNAMDGCITYIHEVGHLAGYLHEDTSVAGGIMRTGRKTLKRYKPCLDAAGLRLSLKMAKRAVRDEMVNIWPKVKNAAITCKKLAVDRRKCTAAWPKHKQSWEVHYDDEVVTLWSK